jgi:hypothetical protein
MPNEKEIETRATGRGERRIFQPSVSTAPVPNLSVPLNQTSSGQSQSGGAPKLLAGVALVSVLSLALLTIAVRTVSPLRTFVRIEAYFSETWDPSYQKHKTADPNMPLQLTNKDLDVEATKAATAAAKKHLPISRVQAVTPYLLQALVKNEVEIYTIRAYDTCRVDGDWITIIAPNATKQGSFMIDHGGTLVSIPVIKGQTPEIELNADKDGVGGVTVGLQTSSGMWYSQVLPEGSIQRIPLVIQ